ncbi:hypothetical protein EU537_03835 [Candidatus Thorarchaeota archaeon]|nr:MAG: hypothetical protein EU537_03835 [Candidatus Thorarchaeota archaeon]
MNKKAAAVIVIIIGAIALAPVAMYGVEVQVADVSMTLGISSILGSLRFNPAQVPSFDIGLQQVQIDVSSQSSYEYALSRITGRTETSESNSNTPADVQITIEFTLTTPSNQTIVFTLNPGQMQGTGEKQVRTILGPDEGISVTGEFHLTIVISIQITPPTFDNPVVDLELNPVNRTFSIPSN